VWWLLEALNDRYPWLAPGIVVVVLVVGLLTSLGCASVPTEQGPMRPGLRVVARCPTELGTVVLAYPISGTLASMNVVLGAIAGAAIGTAVSPGAGSAAGAGAGAIVGVLVDVLHAMRSGPDPVPSCPPGSSR
jgi:outer membrane lipoprotein SlyB